MKHAIYPIFFLSGATGLVYQVIWVRLTGLVFGNTSFSIATVLGAFMAGLALGGWLLGRMADRYERPLRLYGVFEVLIGVTAALVPFAFRAFETVYWGLAPTLEGIPGASLFVRFAYSFVIMVIPTFLMGGTLPVLARFFVRRTSEVDARLGTLYSLNTFGAAAGTLAAALFLIPTLGSQLTTIWIAALNVGLGLLAIRIDLNYDPAPAGEAAAEPEEERAAPGSPAQDRLVLLTLFVSGFVAMTYEVAWTRALASILGSSTYAFAIMLVTFLVGIAAGSAWAGRYRPVASPRILGLFQLGVAVGGLIFLTGYIAAPYLLVGLIRALFYSFPAVMTIQFLVSSALMILATFFMGATFPIAAQLYSTRLRVLGQRIGGIYSVNTVGAIFGSLAAGFLLLPVIGTERTILAGLFLNSAVALLLLVDAGGRMRVARWAAVGLLLVSTLAMRGGVFWDPGMLDRGVLIYARQFEARPELKIAEHYTDTDVVYFAEGRNATISVRRGNGYVGLRTNGKVDASNGRDMTTQLLMAYLPGFHHPSPEEVLVIGHGGGVTTGAATVFPETVQVDCVEIEPAVIGAAPWFEEFNRRSWDHPKIRLIEGDARNFLNVSGKTYDVIISEPSNPWIAGVGSLFTAEFYELAARSLKPDGIIAQWVQLYELSPEDVRMVLGEFQRQFPEVSVWNMGVGDLVLLGSRQPLQVDPERMARIFAADPSIQRDFEEFLSMHDPLGVFAHYVMGTEAVEAFASGALRNTDDRPLLEFRAPRNLFRDTWNMNVELLNEYRAGMLPEGLAGPAREQAYAAMMEPLIALGDGRYSGQALRELATMERSSDEPLFLTTARLNLDSRRYDEAEEVLTLAAQAADEGDPRAADREELWGMLYSAREDRPRAILHYLQAITLAPERNRYLRQVAELYALNREWEEAASWMERFIRTGPYPEASYWQLLGEYRIAAGREAEAVEAFERALELEPYSYLARLRLAEVLESREEIETAIDELEFLTVYAVDRDPQIYTRLANIYLEAGRVGDARRVLEKAARVFPVNTEIYKLRRSAEAR